VDLDYQKLGVFEDVDGIEKVQILLVAIRKEVTDSYLDTLQQAGLAVEVLDVNSFALIRTIREHLRTFGSEEAVVLINIEFDRTEISIIVNGVPHFSRTVTIGMLQMQQALALAMDLPPSRDPEILQGIAIPVTQFERFDSQAATVNPGIAALMQVLGELADELQRSLDFYLNESQGVEVVQLLLAGPGGGLVQLDEYFSQTLNIPTIKVDPLESLMIETEQSFSSIERPSLATVLGLGLRII
jgi:type IV pilus assembly protein PilM